MDEGYLLTATPPDLEHGEAPLGPPVPAQLLLLTLDEGYLLTATPPDLERGVAPLGSLAPAQPLLLGRCSLALLATTLDLGRRVAPPGRHRRYVMLIRIK